MDKTLKKAIIAYLVCLGLSCLLAYIDRNDSSGVYLTPATRAYEIIVMAFFLLGVAIVFYLLYLLLSKLFTLGRTFFIKENK
jgi:hypothetical protein